MASIPLIFSIVFSSICIVSLYLGIYTLYANTKSTTHRLFFAITVALSIWSFGFAVAISAPDLETCLFWRRFAALGWGVFFSILLHFAMALTGKTALLNRWWKYVLLYFPAAVCLAVFTYIPWLNPQQYNLVQTPFGWVNVSINNYWDWFFIFYYVSYPLTSIFFMKKWGKTASSKNKQKQASLISNVFLVTLVLGAFTESFVNNVFFVKIPQLAPIIMLLPVLAIAYAMQKYGFLDARKFTSDSQLFGRQIRKRIIHYLAVSLFVASILYVIVMYFVYENKNLFSTLMFSGCLIIIGIFFELVERAKKSTRFKDFAYAAAFFMIIPALTFNFIEYASITVWAHAFIFLIISIAMISRITQIAVATSILLTQLAVFLLKPVAQVQIDAVDHVGRIGISAISVWIAFFVMNVFRAKLLENAEQLSFQKMVAEISTRYVSVGEKGFAEVTNETLRRTSEFVKAEGMFIYLFNNGRDKVSCAYAWTGSQISTVSDEAININDFPYLRYIFSTAGNLEIYDINDLVAWEYNEIVQIFGEQTKSLLIMPMENNNYVYGYLVVQSVTRHKTWSTGDKNNLMIIANIIAGAIERVRQEKQINFMAYHDTLTGLPNRTLFRDRLNQAISLAERTSKMIAVIFMDLDSFKSINDTMGHEVGDELLIKVARELTASFRKSDTVSRFGGDEFLIMVNNLDNVKDIYKIAEKLSYIFKLPFTVGDQRIYVSASFGIAVYPFDGKDADTLIRNADIAMYEAKSRGKGQHCLCTEDMKEEVLLKHKLSNKLYRAIENNELLLHYQPLISAKTGEIMCLEALVRWRLPEYGLISPEMFIPLAEQNGLIIPIGEWVLKTACRQAKAWLEQGLPPVQISVNVSVIQLRNSRFVSTVKNILQETGLKPEFLNLEITESAAVKESDNIIKTLRELRKLGIEISIDDFGTEYSSLSRLNHMPVNRIKIDKSFICNLFKSEKDQALVKGMIHLSRTLGLRVVAEGVEDKAQLDFLREHGCDEIQGYFISNPISADAVFALLRTRMLTVRAEMV